MADPLTPNVAAEFVPPNLLPPPPAQPVFADDLPAPPAPMGGGLDIASLAPPPQLLAAPGPSAAVSPTLLPPPPVQAGAKLPPPPGMTTSADVQLAPEEDIELEEPDAPQLTAVQLAEQRALGQAAQLDQQANQLGRLGERRKELIAEYAVATTPEERRDLEKRLAAITEADQNVREAQRTTRDGIEESAAELQAQVGLEQQQLQNEAAQEIAARRKEVQADAEAARLRRESELQSLEGQLTEDRDALRETLNAGPTSVQTGQLIVELMGESLRASLGKTVPNYGPIMARAQKRNESAYKQRAQARMDVIGLTGDKIKDSQRLRDEKLAQAKAGDVAILTEVETRLQRELKTATQPLDRVRVATTLESVRVERQRKEAQAIAARQEADRRRAKEDADIALTQAKTAKELAAASKAEAEAAKKRRGTGGTRAAARRFTTPAQLRALPPKVAADVNKRGVRNERGDYMTNPDGSFVMARDAKNATEVSQSLEQVENVNDALKKIEALRDEYGHEFDMGNSAALQAMKAEMTNIELILKEHYTLGVLSGSDYELMQRISGGDPSGWFSKTPTWAALRDRMEDSTTRKLRKIGYKGSYDLSEYRPPKAATAKESRTRWSEAYSPSTGVAPTDSRMAEVERELTAIERKFGGVDDPDYAIQAGASMSRYLRNEGPKTVKRIEGDIRKAKTDAERQRLESALSEEQDFQRRLKTRRARLSMMERGGKSKVAQWASEQWESAARDAEKQEQETFIEAERVPTGTTTMEDFRRRQRERTRGTE